MRISLFLFLYCLALENCIADDESIPAQWKGGNLLFHRQPLWTQIDEKSPIRVNIAMIGVTEDLTGGPLSIMRFANVLITNGFNVRWINVDGSGVDRDDFLRGASKYPFLAEFVQKVEFLFHASASAVPILFHPEDMFVATFFYTAQIAHFTLKSAAFKNKNFIYFIQDTEWIFFKAGTGGFMEAMDSYRYPHFPIYSTPFLQRYFRAFKMGQYEFLPDDSSIEKLLFATEPAIKRWPTLNVTYLSRSSRRHTLVTYTRVHVERNAYDLTIDSLKVAVCENIFDDTWKFIGLGALQSYTINLGSHCGKNVELHIKKHVAESKYFRILRTGDIGLSLMMSPHPSLPPFDLAAAGLATVTNEWQTKTEADFLNISDNFVVVKPYISNIVSGLAIAVNRSRDIAARQKGSTNLKWEHAWDGERCYGKALLQKVKSWIKDHKEPLWPMK